MSRAPRTRHVIAGASTALLLSLAPVGVARAAGDTAAPAAAGTCTLPVPLRPGDFSQPLRIDNRFFPLRPGTSMTYRGTTVNDAGRRVPHTVVFTVTDLFKQVGGVRSRVIHDVDIISGQVAEAELSFFAQDDRGAVWNLGEYPEEFDNGQFAGAPSTWISGQRNATGGIHMLADPAAPQVRGQEYLQGRSPSIDFLDCAAVADVGGTTTVPAGRFTGTLTTHETSPLDSRTAIQTKIHAPGVGIVRIGHIADPEGEELALASLDRLAEPALERIDAQVVAMDSRGNRISAVYRTTGPLHESDLG
jgi:hypothetical protein